jgi:hypothetical protein
MVGRVGCEDGGVVQVHAAAAVSVVVRCVKPFARSLDVSRWWYVVVNLYLIISKQPCPFG